MCTWIAIFRAIKSSHIPIGNVIGAAHRIIFGSRDTRTISSSLCGDTRCGATRCGATRCGVAQFIIIEYYGIIGDPV